MRAQAEEAQQTATSEDFSGKICSRCHTRNKEYAEFCTHCGHQLPWDDWNSTPSAPPMGEYTPFQSPWTTTAGEVYTETERLGNVTAKDMAAVVGQNTVYYIPRFRRINSGEKSQWNWSAFVLGPFWLLFRKQYLFGILLLLIQNIVLTVGYYWTLPVSLAKTTEELVTAVQTVSNNKLALPVSLLLCAILVVRILLAIYANALYKTRCEKKIIEARDKTPDLSSAELGSVGGASMVTPMICYFVSNVVMNFVSLYLLSL